MALPTFFICKRCLLQGFPAAPAPSLCPRGPALWLIICGCKVWAAELVIKNRALPSLMTSAKSHPAAQPTGSQSQSPGWSGSGGTVFLSRLPCFYTPPPTHNRPGKKGREHAAASLKHLPAGPTPLLPILGSFHRLPLGSCFLTTTSCWKLTS